MGRILFLLILVHLCFCAPIHSQNGDIDILKKINLERNTSLDPSFKFISNTVTPLSIAAPVGYLAYAFIKKDSSSKSNAIFVGSTMAIANLISISLKYAVNRERPFVTYPFIEQVASVSTHSFPSGHTSSAFALATSISMTFPKWHVITGAYLWAGGVGYSRMHLGVHYPSDVFAGALIGSGSAFLSKRLTQWINSDKRKKWVRRTKK